MKKLILFMLIMTYGILLNAQQEIFYRKAVIPVPTIEPEGINNIVSGVDFDNDGRLEIFAVNTNFGDSPDALIPRIYKFEFNPATNNWDSVWCAILTNVPKQNTWATLAWSDLDNDGKKEIIWGPCNFLDATTNPNPTRIAIFEQRGTTGDALGVASGNNSLPNCQWTITDSTMKELRPFRWIVADPDNDGTKEIVFADRQSNYRFGIISVSAVPDNGTPNPTWTLEKHGYGAGMNASVIYDLAIIGSNIYIMHSNGVVTKVKYSGGNWTINAGQNNVIPGGTWKSACVVDINNDNVKEIVVAGWSGATSTKIYLLQESSDTLKTTEISDVSNLIGAPSTARLYGGDYGDIDSDGKLDFVFGTRDATPNGAIVRLKYIGGTITAPASYQASLIDQGIISTGGRFDQINIANMDADPVKEIVYTNCTDGRVPIVILDRIVANVVSISEARKDLNNDYIPDHLNDTLTVIGVVNSINLTKSANRFGYTIQDNFAGINVTKGSQPGGGPVYNVGDRLLVKGKIGHFRGTTQMEIIDTLPVGCILLDKNNPVTPVLVDIETYKAAAEKYESRYIELKGVTKKPGSVNWPPINTDANMTIWDGYDSLVFRIDQDANLDENPEPVWPINVKGVATQYTSSATVYNDGYQITPMFYADITANVQAPPIKYFFLKNPLNNAKIILTDTNATYQAKWSKSFDVNPADTIKYSFFLLKSPVYISASSKDTFFTFKGSLIKTWLGTADSLTTKWTVAAKDQGTTNVFSVDTFTITFIKKLTGVEDNLQLPYAFYLDQNYPNPFNPSTVINFGLPKDEMVDLRIYNLLGEEIAILINNKELKAGNHSVDFKANNLASGTYIYKISAGNKLAVKKMLFLK
jgi:hypothetical protein